MRKIFLFVFKPIFSMKKKFLMEGQRKKFRGSGYQFFWDTLYLVNKP
jgi:hypothetical protein